MSADAAERALPTFFLVGAGKAGTTSLHRYLNQHPQVFVSRVKEPSYFADEIRTESLDGRFAAHVASQSARGNDIAPGGWLVSDWDDYVALFRPGADAIARGDCTPSYLWSETAARNIHARLPAARIIMILRDPAERAYSHYLHLLSEGLIDGTFREHISRCEKDARSRISPFYPFLEVGLYCEQVRRYLALFPREHVRIYWYEEDWRDPVRLLGDLFAFIGVDDSFRPDFLERALPRRRPRFGPAHRLARHWWHAVRPALPPSLLRHVSRIAYGKGVTPMTRDDRAYLVEYYRADIRGLGDLVGRDLSAWLSH